MGSSPQILQGPDSRPLEILHGTGILKNGGARYYRTLAVSSLSVLAYPQYGTVFLSITSLNLQKSHLSWQIPNA